MCVRVRVWIDLHARASNFCAFPRALPPRPPHTTLHSKSQSV